MDRLKHMKENLMNCVQAQIGSGLDKVDTKELGEAIDMIKDLEEAIYYGSITKAMEEKEKEQEYAMKNYSMYPPMMYYPPTTYERGRPRNYDMEDRMMYYDGNSGGRGGNSNSGGNNARGGGSRGYDGWMEYPREIRDYREGKSPITRRNYMESKELHHDKSKQMQELDKYAQELTEDIMEMVHDATPEEKMTLSQKLTTLANKIR